MTESRRSLCRALAASLAAAVLLASTACLMGPNYKRPEVPTPHEFRGGPTPAEAASLADRPWWELFQDETLNALIDEALKNSYDARGAALRVEEARERMGIERSNYYPKVDYAASYARERQSIYVNPDANGKASDVIRVEGLLSWEIDIWGKLRRQNEAARAQFFATEQGQRAVLLSLIAEVATEYFQLLDLDRQLKISHDTVAAFTETRDLFQRRLEGGAASALETSRAEAALGTVQAKVPDLERQIALLENSLCLLIGRLPGPIERIQSVTASALPPTIPAGLPASLLERRPDVLASEQILVAANARIGVTKAEFFPTLSLTGLFGGVSPELSDLFAGGKSWSIGAGIFGPLFNAGATRGRYEVAKIQAEQAKVEYERTVNLGFAEVASELVAHQKLAEVELYQDHTVSAYEESVRLATMRYNSGLSSYFEVLDAMQQLFPSQLVLSTTQSARLINYVQLYKALGGGWSPDTPLEPEADAQADGTAAAKP